MTVYLDTFKHLYIPSDSTFFFPESTNTGLTKRDRGRIFRTLRIQFSDSLAGLSTLLAPRPAAESYHVHFATLHTVENQHYIHWVSILCRYMGGADSADLQPGLLPDTSPAFRTDRIYFKSRLVPVAFLEPTALQDFDPDKQFARMAVYDKIKHVVPSRVPGPVNALFDDPDYSTWNTLFSKRLLQNAPYGHYSLHMPLVFDDFGVCQLNLLKINPAGINEILTEFHKFLYSFSGSNQFFVDLFLHLRFERIYSKAGNPHWKIETPY